MSLPIWITKSGNLGTIPEQQYWSFQVEANDSEDINSPIYFELVAGTPPQGIHISGFGTISGNPETTLNVLGVPNNVAQSITSRFAVRARVASYYTNFVGDGSTTHYTIPTHIDFDAYRVLVIENGNPKSAYFEIDDSETYNVTVILNKASEVDSELVVALYSATGSVADRTFELTVVGESPPEILNAAELIGLYIEGQYVDFALEIIDLDEETVTLSIVNGELPPGLVLDQTAQTISGYLEPITFSVDSTTDYRSYTFGVLADDGKEQDLHPFEIRVIPTQLMAVSNTLTTADADYITADRTTKHSPIIYTPAGELGPVKHDNYFMFKFDGRDFDDDVILYTYDLGTGVGFDQIEAPFDEVEFDEVVAATVYEGSFPPGLTLDEDTGWLYGYIPPQSELSNTYLFYVRAFKKFVTEPPYPEDYSTRINYYSERKQYLLTVNGENQGVLTWISDSFLGSIENGAISEFQIQATVDNGHTLYYELVAGGFNQVPAAMKLLDNGMIIGRASFATFSIDGDTTTFDIHNLLVTDPTTFDQYHRFNVRVYDLEGTVNTSREFSILIYKANDKPYENLYLVGRLPLAQRTQLASILSDTNLIPYEDLYRAEDTYFGLQTNLRMLVANGLAPLTASSYISAMNIMHYPKRLFLGDIKSARVVDADFNVLYEVVYVEVKDATDTDQKVPVTSPVDIRASHVSGKTEVYPNNISNMRKQLIKTIGQVNKELPAWMIDRQKDGKVLGYTKACVLAYVKPGKADKIAYQLSKLANLDQSNPSYIDFKRLIFDVDRYLWDSELTINYNKTTGKFEVSGETTFDFYSVRYQPTLNESGQLVYQFNAGTIVHGPDSDGLYFHPDQPLGHYGSEYVMDPASLPSGSQTTFDQDSLHFLTGKDVYTPQDENDKYLMFPENNILD